jgi:signal transduction histidine kinase
VEDKGIGFEEKALDKVFVPFQRPHGRSEYEGLGMRLAICKKIVERHGGKITTRSEHCFECGLIRPYERFSRQHGRRTYGKSRWRSGEASEHIPSSRESLAAPDV